MTAKMLVLLVKVHQMNDPLRRKAERLPKPGTRCPFTGLSRSGLNELVLATEANKFKPPVRSILLRKRGRMRGTRLIVLDSLIKYLYEHSEATIQ